MSVGEGDNSSGRGGTNCIRIGLQYGSIVRVEKGVTTSCGLWPWQNRGRGR